jgi:hypothetical protein
MKTLSNAKYYTRHLFIPPFWRTGGQPTICIASKNSVAIAYRDELVIIQGFSNFSQKVYFEEN